MQNNNRVKRALAKIKGKNVGNILIKQLKKVRRKK